MKKMSALVSIVLLALISIPLAQAQKRQATKDEPFEPNYDREIFKKSSTSIARGDLLACRNRDAQITKGADVNIDDFAKTLHGVWVNHNNRSLHGITVETDNAFYIDMRGRTGTAILIDRNNMGDFSLSKPYTAPGSKYRKTARPLTMSFVNCTYQFIDRYVKVSDEVPLEVLAASTRVRFAKGTSLEKAWERIVSAGYFTAFDMLTESKEPGSARRRVSSATLGDGQRMAVLPDGTKVDEKGIEEGLVPGAEYHLPMMVGGFFRITLTPRQAGPNRQYQAVHWRMDAEYRATGVGLKPGDVLHGVEQGVFSHEGGAYVAAKRTERAKGDNNRPTEDYMIDDSYSTDDCGAKNELVSQEAFLNGTPATPLGHRDHNLPKVHDGSLHFERVVIGAPGIDMLERRGANTTNHRRPK
jgi:hypothetical protein